MSFKLSYDTEPRFDFVFVEAHTVGQDDWTTLPVPGITTQDVGAGCPDNDPFWLALHPFLNHYLTRTREGGRRVRSARRTATSARLRVTGTRRPATRAASRTGTST